MYHPVTPQVRHLSAPADSLTFVDQVEVSDLFRTQENPPQRGEL